MRIAEDWDRSSPKERDRQARIFAWAECTCPLCGAEPHELCYRLPWLSRRLPRWIRRSPFWLWRSREHDARIVRWRMMIGED